MLSARFLGKKIILGFLVLINYRLQLYHRNGNRKRWVGVKKRCKA